MARTRSLKPAFFNNEDLVDCGFEGMILFAGLWTIADRDGRLEDRPRRIKAAIFPYSPQVDVDALLDALAEKTFIRRYEVNGIKYIDIPTWHRHQKPHTEERASTIPRCCSPQPRSLHVTEEVGASPENCGARPASCLSSFLPSSSSLIPSSPGSEHSASVVAAAAPEPPQPPPIPTNKNELDEDLALPPPSLDDPKTLPWLRLALWKYIDVRKGWGEPGLTICREIIGIAKKLKATPDDIWAVLLGEWKEGRQPEKNYAWFKPVIEDKLTRLAATGGGSGRRTRECTRGGDPHKVTIENIQEILGPTNGRQTGSDPQEKPG